MTTFADLKNRFTHHPLKNDQLEKYETIRQTALKFAVSITTVSPESREQSLAITKLEEAVFWANAAIARNEQA